MIGMSRAREISAQAPTRSGFFIGFGLGAGFLSVEDSDRESSVSGYFKIGGALSDRVLLGAESSGWVKDESGVTVSSNALSAMAYVYPNPMGGLFFQGGLGISRLEVDAGDFGSGGETGTALTLGAGYDIGFGGRFGLTPYASFVFGNYDAGNTNVFNVGLGFNWY
jgi:hypothetical protein